MIESHNLKNNGSEAFYGLPKDDFARELARTVGDHKKLAKVFWQTRKHYLESQGRHLET
jgi:hypothetical protein